MSHQNKLSELAKEANKSYTTTEDFSSNKYDKGVLKSRIGSGKISREQKGVQRDVKTN